MGELATFIRRDKLLKEQQRFILNYVKDDFDPIPSLDILKEEIT